MTGIRVLHLISGLGTGGSETMLFKLLAAMDRRAFDQRVISLTAGGALADRLNAIGIDVTNLGMRAGVPHPMGLFRLVRGLRQWRPAIVQTWLYHADLLGTLATRLAGTPALAWNIRCSKMDARYERGLGRVMLQALALLSRRPDVVVTNTEAGRDLHTRLGYAPRRWAVLPNGFDVDTFRPDSDARRRTRAGIGIADDRFAVGLIARFDPIKDHATFLRAAADFAAIEPRAVFVLAGTNVTMSNPPVADLVRASRLGDRAFLLGERSDIAALNAALDVAVCSSQGEGFPNAIGEAMACGVPVTMTDVGDAREIVGDGGIVVPPADPRSLAGAWRSLAALTLEERRAMGVRARQRIEERFDIKAVARRYEALYRELGPRTP